MVTLHSISNHIAKIHILNYTEKLSVNYFLRANTPLRLKEKGLINFGVVYCRVSGGESRFRNLRGKICEYFEGYCNYLKVRLIARRVAVLKAKEDC